MSKKTKDELLKIADGAVENGLFEESITFYNRIIEINPDDKQIWGKKAHALQKLGRNKEAINCIKMALALDPNDAFFWGEKAKLDRKLGDTVSSINSSSKALSLNSDNDELVEEKCKSLMKNEDYAEALECCESALNKFPCSARLLTIKSEILLFINNDFDKGYKSLVKALENDDTFVKAWLIKAKFLYQRGLEQYKLYKLYEHIEHKSDELEDKYIELFGEAEKCYNKAIKINPDSEEAWLGKAMIGSYFSGSNTEKFELEKIYNKVIELNPKSEEAWLGKAHLYSLEPETALKYYDKTIKINPDSEEAWLGKAEAYSNDGSLFKEYKKFYSIDKTIECYNKVTKINPESEKAWLALGDIYYNQLEKGGNSTKKVNTLKRKALNCYDKVIKINPKNKKAWESKPYVISSAAEELHRNMSKNELDEIEWIYDKLIEIDPEEPYYWLKKLETIMDRTIHGCRSDCKKAIKIANRAINNFPEPIETKKGEKKWNDEHEIIKDLTSDDYETYMYSIIEIWELKARTVRDFLEEVEDDYGYLGNEKAKSVFQDYKNFLEEALDINDDWEDMQKQYDELIEKYHT
jgi:tetratricopeptide (TPR) repeat protein